MNKSSSPTTGSAASSETSESQSVSDDFQGLNPSRQVATKNWKKIKEIGEKDEKRPPWRMVSVSTLPKADKNALLRAKLLDASRRMRAGKNQIGVQTDLIPTKLMKEVPTQVDDTLIPLENKGILTDGTITIPKTGVGEFLLTHSVAQMTEFFPTNDAETQTTTPRISSYPFFDLYHNQNYDAIHDDLAKDLADGERLLIEQRKVLQSIDQQLKNSGCEIFVQRPEADLSDDSLSVSKGNDSESKTVDGFPKLPKSTLASWHFDFPEDDDDLPVLPRCVGPDIRRPWNSFRDMIIGNKLASMKLSPTPVRKASMKKKSVSWRDTHYAAVSELVQEANALLNVFDQMSLILGPDVKLNQVPDQEDTNIQYLSEYWDPILAESERSINEKLNSLKNPSRKRFEPVQSICYDDFDKV